MLEFHKTGDISIAELIDNSVIISKPQDVLDLMGDMSEKESTRLIIREENLHPDFFRLYTGLAGEILQKISNYRFKLAIIGDFSEYNSKTLHDFIRECNKGNAVFFVENLNSALSILQEQETGFTRTK
jgi:hypothetical protein